MKIETDRLTIRQLTESDFDALHSLLSNESVMRYSVNGPHSEEKTREWLSDTISSYAERPLCMWALAERRRDAIIGICGFFPLQEPGQYEIGYRVLPEFHGKGYATEASKAVRDYAIEAGIKQFWAYIEKDNKRSIRIAEKIGMGFVRDDIYHNIPVSVYQFSDGKEL